MELNSITPQPPAQFQAEILHTSEARPRINVSDSKKKNNQKKGYSLADFWTNKRAKVAKWAVSQSVAARVGQIKAKRDHKSDNVLYGGQRDVDKRTRRDFYEFKMSSTS